jgi:hypothetical protein
LPSIPESLSKSQNLDSIGTTDETEAMKRRENQWATCSSCR